MVEVPEDAIAITLTLEDAPVDLDLYARFGEAMEDYTQADHSATSIYFNDMLRISRYDYPALESGRYYIDVAYPFPEEEPIVGKQRLETIPFSLTASLIRSRVDATLDPDQRYAAVTNQEDGFFRTFVVNVPPEASTLRIDLDEVNSDMDLYARFNAQIVSIEDADHEALSILGRETLIIDQDSQPPLQSGPWYINVFDPFQLGPVPFAVYASFSADPPQALLNIPALEIATDPQELAVQANVQISLPDGSGSGTLVSPDGLILTNYHVVETAAGAVAEGDDLVISLTMDPRKPPLELFRAQVVAADESLDLALVEITSGLYRQPLPENYPLPYLQLGDAEALTIGSPITILGFPAAGGTGSRTSVTLTRGVISGFDTADIGSVIKTDADISSGNSGGAALDGSFRLVGVPTFVVPEYDGNAQIGYIHPISLLPAEWTQMIAERQE
ncbi:MAG: trypsin-like peptidase domain-containing protein [Synechococcaceae cyanobacterium SM2_3_1]|nr:trypsin-like peptidase domain-containing protein [Synechococcaceae cyanobacterium SM2_3_1]